MGIATLGPLSKDGTCSEYTGMTLATVLMSFKTCCGWKRQHDL
jgi:hypothetical protein